MDTCGTPFHDSQVGRRHQKIIWNESTHMFLLQKYAKVFFFPGKLCLWLFGGVLFGWVAILRTLHLSSCFHVYFNWDFRFYKGLRCFIKPLVWYNRPFLVSQRCSSQREGLSGDGDRSGPVTRPRGQVAGNDVKWKLVLKITQIDARL